MTNLVLAIVLAQAAPVSTDGRNAVPGARALVLHEDPADAMVGGIHQYLRDAVTRRKPAGKADAAKLARILGVVDKRVPAAAIGGSHSGPTRWPVVEGITAEGFVLQPKGRAKANLLIVAAPEEQPETIAHAAAFAAGGARVAVIAMLGRESKWSGNAAIGKSTSQSHREFIYRMAFPFARHPVGWEVQKALAVVDWFDKIDPAVPIAAIGTGDGGGVALFAAALDPRIRTAGLDGFTGLREDLPSQPIDRNLMGILRDFDERSVRELVAAPRRLHWQPDYVAAVAKELGIRLGSPHAGTFDRNEAEARQERQFRELVDFHQALIAASRRTRDGLWTAIGADGVRERFRREVIGRLPAASQPLNVRVRESYASEKWRGYEVMFDVAGPVFCYGVLLVPKDLAPGERRALVVAQHGLQGRPQDLFQAKGKAFETYRDFAATLADQGYVVYLPQNPYIGDNFRAISRWANPLGLSLYSFILAQYEKMLELLKSLPYVDADRIGFYGLSYGGKTAMFVPPFLPDFKAVICSGNFNEWVYKLVSIDAPYTYLFTQEYEIFEWGLANIASHAELARLIAPRPFLVERGHSDGVGVDEWVNFEYAKVRRHYAQSGVGDRTGIAHFDGPHRIDGAESIPFLLKFLPPRAPAAK